MRDADVPKALREHFGHGDLGIYLAVQSSGTLMIGQTFALDGLRLTSGD
jgi:hypothetical protein